ncbi:MAG TPA: hypothetical protein VFA24_01350 [Gaiellaceae bacterium]|nr:hypothetical protein [Gaiellaceae bacterium]
MTPEPLSLLVLANAPPGAAGTIHDHVGAFTRYSRHAVTVVNPRRGGALATVDLRDYDAVVVHYTIHPYLETHVSPAFREQLRAFDGVKVQFLQDEYRTVDLITASMRDLGIDVLYTAVPEGAVEAVYGPRLEGVQVVPTLTGYVPERWRKTRPRPLTRRPIEVGYRGRVVPWWLGRLGQDKIEIGRGVLQRAASHGLVCDIAWNEADRMYGARWARFLASCRTTLTTESGASIVDFDGSIEQRTRDYLDEHPAATFEEVHAAVLAAHEGNAVINTISPRVFEAAAAGSALIAFPGEYDGVIERDRHYIQLEKDFSNFDEVIGRVRDLHALRALVDRTYEDLIASGRYSYEAFIRTFDEVVAERARGRRRATASRRRDRAVAPLALRRSARKPTGLDARSTLTKSLATALVVGSDPELRAVLWRYARNRGYRSSVSLGRLTEDLLRLGAVRRAHRGYPTRKAFAIEALLDSASSRLLLVSRPKQAPVRGEAAEAIHAAIGDGRITEVVWNHRAVGSRYAVPLAGGRQMLPVGYHGLTGVHEFSALRAVASDDPEVLWSSVCRLTAAPRRWRRTPLESSAFALLPRPLLRTVARGPWARKSRLRARRRRARPAPLRGRLDARARRARKRGRRLLDRGGKAVHRRMRQARGGVVRVRPDAQLQRALTMRLGRSGRWRAGG